MTDKLRSYLGFARRAGKLTLGVTAVEAERRKIFLLVADADASPNTKKVIGQIRARCACPYAEVEDLSALVGKPVKLAAVREEHLAAAAAEEIAKSRLEAK